MDREFIIIKNNEYQNYSNDIKESFIELKTLTSKNATILEEMKSLLTELFKSLENNKVEQDEINPVQNLYTSSKDFINGFLFGTLLSVMFYKFL